jgi:K(+)-stimulated pyrophosphate-energized sodium pump
MAVQGNVRVAAASKRSFSESLKLAYRSGTITGMLTDGLGLFGGTIIFIIFGIASPDVLLGFGFGGTLLALFMRVGGGIYTKAADVGADLVGKVEAGIRKTTLETRLSLRTLWETMSATAQAWRRIFSSPMKSPSSPA